MRLRYYQPHPTEGMLSVRYELLSGRRRPTTSGTTRIVTWKGKDYVIGAGTSDSVMFYRDLDDPESLYVLTVNRHLDYIGLDRLNPEWAIRHHSGVQGYYAPDYMDSFFLQDPDEAKDYGKPLMDMEPHNQIRYMAEWITPWLLTGTLKTT